MTEPPQGNQSNRPTEVGLPHAGVRFPPPLLFLAGVVGGLLLDRWRALPLLPLDLRGPGLILAWLLIAAWALLALSAIGLFRQAGTSLLPHRPAARLVVTGPYRYSRNPMYLALTALYLGVTLLANSIWILLLLPIVLALLQITVIRREERYLESAFGPAYREYRARVRRWL